MGYTIKNYQRDAIDQLKDNFDYLIKKQSGSKLCVLKAPTGSGKTFIVSRLINELAVQDWNNENFCVIWACPGTGELHEQSYQAVKKYLEGFPICSLINNEFFGSRKYIKDKEIVFVNWEKLIQKDSDTGEWSNNLMKDKEGANFIDVIDTTKKNGTKIILIIDESHIGKSQKSRINEFRNEIILADITLEMSATPITDAEPDVIIKSEDVIKEGMIKKELIVNKTISDAEIEESNLDSEKLILQKGLEKRNEIKQEYLKLGVNINPLVLIQIPNTTAGEEKKQTIRDFLSTKGITEENGKLKLWCDKHEDFDKTAIKDFDDITEYLIFKTAVATGWDCPRAHILIKFRDSKSENFDIQTIGRILRMPEAKHYNSYVLDNAYMYTNLSNFEFDKDSYNPNAIKTKHSDLKPNYSPQKIASQIGLKSFYISRAGHYNSVTHSYIENEFFEKEFVRYFEINENDSTDEVANKMSSKGIELNTKLEDRIISETSVDSNVIDSIAGVNNEGVNVTLAINDLNNQIRILIKNNLNGLAYKRSYNTVLIALRSCLNKYYNIFPRSEKILNFDKIIVQNKEIFGDLINKSICKFKESLSNSIRKGEIENDYFEILQSRSYSTETHTELSSSKSIYQPLFVLKKDDEEVRNKLERNFIAFMDCQNEIEWFWENGSEPNKINFGIGYDDDTNTFRPDFIVKFKNGYVGIFDTKAKDNRLQNLDTKIKAEALYKFIKDMNSRVSTAEGKTPHVIGGIVIQPNDNDNENFYYSNNETYKLYKDDKYSWKNIKELLNQIKIDMIKKGL